MRKTIRGIFGIAVVILLIAVAMIGAGSAVDTWDGTTIAESFEAGSGTSADPYQIKTGAQLAYLAQQVNSEVDYSKDKYFILTDDINLDNHQWTPIGETTSFRFMGNFDGNNKTISNLKIEGSEGANNK